MGDGTRRDWLIFLHEGSFGLNSDRLKTGPENSFTLEKLFDPTALQRRWRDLTFDLQLQSAAADVSKDIILSLKTELEDRFSIRVCYIAGDKLPVGKREGKNRLLGTERETKYDLALRQQWLFSTPLMQSCNNRTIVRMPKT
ncbi:28eafabc-e279-48f5-921f-c2f0e3cf3100-CDS [Sclerotinia trifoliorum]|uniref:28eafabc-e279-48f5-921f-c2f0e3cf3100-CDS n=1 Tax=Sclerotinia trifoliorum TaxID=28548 RepID=A0A8H2ZS38_9HELO|nr:28eafabc-e279-48f5-921f-c2f0e3cf3100-CDS [Sclerotinia trifoliorum]